MKRFASFILALVLCIPTVAFAAEETESKTFYVKYGCTNAAEVWESIANEIAPDGYEWASRAPDEVYNDGSISVDGVSYPIVVVKPVYKSQPVPNISSNSAENKDADSLAEYVYKYNKLEQTSTEYENALGKAPEVTMPKSRIRDYQMSGGSYTITAYVNGVEVSQSFTVVTADGDTPEVSIGADGIVYCTPERVEFSKDRKSWRGIKDGDSISSEYYGENLYFRTPASGYNDASSYIKVYCRDSQSAPTGKLELESTSFSITLTNSSEFKGCEFSIDGKRYSTRTTEWTGLEANKSYTVYARYTGDSSYFPSSPLTERISTKQGTVDGVSIKQVVVDNKTYINAAGTTHLTVSNNMLSASYTDSDLKELKSAVKEASRKSTPVVVLDVSMAQEEGDSRDFKKVKFSLPATDSNTLLRVSTPYLTVVRNAPTSSILLTEGAPTSTKKLKEWAEDKEHIYRIDVNNNSTKAGGSRIVYPWSWGTYAALDSVRVYWTDLKGEDVRNLDYQVVGETLRFDIPADGYFSVTAVKSLYDDLPFEDCQTSWAYSYIRHAYFTELVKGTTATTFEPDTLVTRSQVIQLLARLDHGYVEGHTYANLPYTDVTEKDWFYSALTYCYYRGVLKPDGDEFEQSAPVSRAEVAALVAKMFPYNGTIYEPSTCVDRESVPAYAIKAVDMLNDRRIMTGKDGNRFDPEGQLTRAELVTILYRVQAAPYRHH